MKSSLCSNQQKLTEKAFTQSITISIIGILLCIVALCSTTWAWFAQSISSDGNSITSGRFDLSISVKNSAPADLTVTTDASGNLTCTLDTPGTYTVTLNMSAANTVSKGFCLVTAGGTTYKTALIQKDDPNAFTFYIDAKQPTTVVTFEAVWGKPVSSDIQNGGTLTVGAASNATEPAT